MKKVKRTNSNLYNPKKINKLLNDQKMTKNKSVLSKSVLKPQKIVVDQKCSNIVTKRVVSKKSTGPQTKQRSKSVLVDKNTNRQKPNILIQQKHHLKFNKNKENTQISGVFQSARSETKIGKERYETNISNFMSPHLKNVKGMCLSMIENQEEIPQKIFLKSPAQTTHSFIQQNNQNRKNNYGEHGQQTNELKVYDYSKIEIIEQQNEFYRDQNNFLKKENETIRNRNAVISRQKQSLASENADLYQKLRNLQAVAEKIKNESTLREQMALSNHMNETAKIICQVNTLSHQCGDLETENRQLTALVNRLTVQIEKLTEKRASCDQLISVYKTQQKKLKQENEKSKASMKQMETQIVKLRENLSEYNSVKLDYQEKLRNLSKEKKIVKQKASEVLQLLRCYEEERKDESIDSL